jgi:hypothetical protein
MDLDKKKTPIVSLQYWVAIVMKLKHADYDFNYKKNLHG